MNRTQATAIIKACNPSVSSLKAAYREAALKYHPDRGGSLEQMKLVNLAYEVLSKFAIPDDEYLSGEHSEQTENSFTQHAEWASGKVPLTEVIKEKYNAIKHIPGIKIELIGSWLWVSNTDKEDKVSRLILVKNKFKWSPKKGSWYFFEGKYYKKTKKQYDMGDLRTMWRSRDLEKEEHKQI